MNNPGSGSLPLVAANCSFQGSKPSHLFSSSLPWNRETGQQFAAPPCPALLQLLFGPNRQFLAEDLGVVANIDRE